MVEILTWIRDVGFPIAVAAFLLVRVEVELRRSSERICDRLEQVGTKIDAVGGRVQAIAGRFEVLEEKTGGVLAEMKDLRREIRDLMSAAFALRAPRRGQYGPEA